MNAAVNLTESTTLAARGELVYKSDPSVYGAGTPYERMQCDFAIQVGRHPRTCLTLSLRADRDSHLNAILAAPIGTIVDVEFTFMGGFSKTTGKPYTMFTLIDVQPVTAQPAPPPPPAAGFTHTPPPPAPESADYPSDVTFP